MLRWNRLIVAALFAIVIPLTADADEVRIVHGDFVFTHAPVNPTDAEICYSPEGQPVGLDFSVTSESFDGQIVTTTKGKTRFTGSGEASGCAYFAPIDGVAAKFEGSFTWQTTRGDLSGTFELLDFPTDVEGVFAALIFIKFDGGTGVFAGAKGEAIAEGLDFPFGGLGETAGVVAEITEGEIKLSSH